MTRALLALALLALPSAAQDLYDRELLAQPGVLVANEFADFDGDGRPDLLAALQLSPKFSPPVHLLAVSRGDGRGGFAAPVTSVAPSSPDLPPMGFAVALADLNEDGRPDALVGHDAAGDNSGDLQSLLGDADGSFTLHSTQLDVIPFYMLPYDVEAADFDADGHADGLYTSKFDLAVLLGDGTGSLGAGLVPTHGDYFGKDVDVGDVDGDGLLDLVMTRDFYIPALLWLRGDGLGGFATGVDMPIGISSIMRELVLADFDANGTLDAAVAGAFPPPSADGDAEEYPLLRVVAGHGDGSFDPPVIFDCDASVGEIRAEDMDGSGRPDLVLTTGGEVRVVLDPLGPAGTIDYQAPGGGVPAAGFANTLALGDIDSDGDPDAVYGGGSSDVRLFNDGSGAFEAPTSFALPDVGGLAPLADVDGNGTLDALAVLVGGDLVRMAGDGAGGFGPPQPLPATAVWDLAVADLDGDGDRDIATANHDTHDLSLLIAEGDGFANTKEGGWPWFSWNQSPTRVQAADVDGDGAPDLVVTKSQKSTLSLLHSNGAGGFLPPDDFGPVDVQQPDLELGDMNEDGTLDLVAKLVHLNDGDGHFTPGVSVAEAEVSYSLMGGLELADMDGDGHLDVVFSADVYDPIDADATGLITRAGDGAGGLGSSQVFPAKLFVVATPDLDGDGLRDVLCWGGDSGLMAAFGDGAGDFTHTRAWAPCLLSGQAVGDIDNDGRPDLVLGDGVQPGLVTLLHRETPFAWADLGHALPGAAGAPRLDGHGPLQPATPLFVQVDQLPHDALLTLVVGGSQLAAPFLGGVLVPSPDRILTGLPTGPEGFLALEGTWPAGLPSGFQLWFQAWVPDPSAPKGWAASNALRTTSP